MGGLQLVRGAHERLVCANLNSLGPPKAPQWPVSRDAMFAIN